mgnify:FL=1
MQNTNHLFTFQRFMDLHNILPFANFFDILSIERTRTFQEIAYRFPLQGTTLCILQNRSPEQTRPTQGMGSRVQW